MTYTKEERRDLITYGYNMRDKARRARNPKMVAQWTNEWKQAWQMAGFTGA